MIIEGKKEFLKKLCLILKQGMLNLILGKIFPERYLVLRQLWPSKHYTEEIPVYCEGHIMLDHKEYHHNQDRSDKSFIYCN